MRLMLKFLGACEDSESVEVARSSRPVKYSAHACGPLLFEMSCLLSMNQAPESYWTLGAWRESRWSSSMQLLAAVVNLPLNSGGD